MALRIEAFDVDVTVRRGVSRGIGTLAETVISRLAASPSQRAGAAENGHGAAGPVTAAANGASTGAVAATNGVRNGVPQPELTSGTPRFIAPPLAAPEPKPLGQPAAAPAPPSFAPASFTPLFKRMPAAQAGTAAQAPRQPLRSTGADGGRPLDENTRRQMESFFGASLGDVRVHADTNAAQLAANMSAEALTIGHDIYFGEGKFDPSSQSGKALLGHELTHVLQQRTLDPRRQGMTPGSVDALEMEAQTLARRFQTGAADVKGTGFLVTRYLCTYSVNRPATDDETRRLEALSRRALKACEEMLRAQYPDLLEGAVRALETVEVDIDTSLAGRSDEDIVQLWGHRMAAAIAAKLSSDATPTLAAAAGTVLKQPAKGKGQQPGTTNITVTTETFDIEADNLDGAAAALQGLDEWGKTRWNVTFDYDTTDGVATSVAVTARIKVELPRWTSLSKQPRRVQAEWNRMLTALRRHENEHVRIARERIQKLAGEMVGKPESELPDIHARCLEELDTLSNDFDTRTDHGEKQGVSLDLNVAAKPRLHGSTGTRETAEAEAHAVEQAMLGGATHALDVHAVNFRAVLGKPSGGPPRSKYKAPDAAAFIAKKFPNLKVPPDQITLFQRLLDARAALKEINEDPVWQSILSDDEPRKEALRRESAEWAKDDRVQALVIPTETVLANDILLKEEKDEKTQRARRFREMLYATMLTYPVRLVIAPNALEPELTMKWGPNDWELPNDGGRVTFNNLMGIQKFNVAYQAALVGDQVELLEGMAEVTRFGTIYSMTGKKVGETFGYVYNTNYKVGYEMGRLTGYYDDAKGRQELEQAKGAGARIVLKNPADGFLHVYQLDPSLNSTDLRSAEKTPFTTSSASGMVFLYAKGSEVGAVDEIMTADGFLLTSGGDSYGTGWGAPEVLSELDKFAIGAIMGDAFENGDAVSTFGQIVIGCIPVVGQIADARDVAVGIHKIWTTGGKDGKLQTALSLIGFIPLIGDGIKSAWKAGRKGVKGTLTKEAAKELAAKAVKEGAASTAEPAAKELGERILKNADEVADALKVPKAEVKAAIQGLQDLAGKAAAGDLKAAKEFGEQMGKQLDALGGNAGSLVGMMGGDWAKLAKMLTTSPEGALVGQAMEKWRAAQFATLDKKVAAAVGDVGAQAGVDAAPKMVRTGTPSFASDVDISFLGPMSTQHRNAAIHVMEQQFGPGWRQLMDADIFADPARLHLFEDPLKKLGGTAAKEAGARIIKESELNVFAKMLKDGVPYEEVKRLAGAAGVDMAAVAARQKELVELSIDQLAAELRKGTSRDAVEKMAKDAHIDMAAVDKHVASGQQLYKQLELKLDALHAQFAMAEKAGDVARQAQIAEEMAAIQGKLNAAIPGPYMTPGGGAKHVSRRERVLRPGGGFQAMSPILGYTAVIDDLYMLMHALPEKEFTEKSAKGMAKYGDRLLVTAGQFGVEMKGSTRTLFDQITGLLERARLEKDKPALEKAIGFLNEAKGTLHGQLTDIVSGAKRNASEYLKNTPDAAPSTGQFADKTQAVLVQQMGRIGSIILRKELPKDDGTQGSTTDTP